MTIRKPPKASAMARTKASPNAAFNRPVASKGLSVMRSKPQTTNAKKKVR